MRKFIFLLIAAAAVYATITVVPAEVRQRAFAAVGLAKFFQETAPRYLRSKLSLPENPVAKRERLLEELSQAIGEIERELEVAAPEASAPKRPPAPQTPPGALERRELEKRIERTQELLAQSETVIGELREANPGQGLLAKATERVLDKILPAPKSLGTADGAVCPR